MAKDFANTYEQCRWEYALKEYARITNFLNKFGGSALAASHIARLTERKKTLEQEYPSLLI
jgi:hypothetical protein